MLAHSESQSFAVAQWDAWDYVSRRVCILFVPEVQDYQGEPHRRLHVAVRRGKAYRWTGQRRRISCRPAGCSSPAQMVSLGWRSRESDEVLMTR